MEDNTKIYITVLGDTWDSIAYKLYKDSSAFIELLKLNQEHHNVLMFTAGIKIKYKEIILESKKNIAPWRR